MPLDSFKAETTRYKKHKFAQLIPGSDALAIATLFNTHKEPILVIVNDPYSANRLALEIKLFNPELSLAIYNSTELLPYERISTQKELIASRLKVLWQISLKQLDIVIVQLTTLQTKLCPPEYLNSRMFLLNVGDKISLDSIKHKLVTSNYSLVEQVYEAGEFAVRGGIIDLFPMGSKQLIRIDLFDDEIETLAIIDVKTKQILKNINQFELIPAREYPTDNIPQFITNLSQRFPDPEHLISFKELKNGILPPGCDFYLPLFFSDTSTLFDYLTPNWHIVYYQSLHHQLNTYWQEINKRYEHFYYQYPCLKPNELFVPTDEIFIKLNQYKTYEIAETGELDKNIHQISEISINNKLDNPFLNLEKFRTTFNGKVIIIIDGIGRMEIMRQTLERNNLKPQIIKTLTEAIEHNIIYLIKATLYSSFICNKWAFISEQELYRHNNINQISKKRNTNHTIVEHDSIIRDLAEIQVGDYVVHVNHGIAKYLGLNRQNIADIEYEMLELEYQDGAKIFIPVYNLHLISRYAKLDNIDVTLNKLGSSQWSKIKSKLDKKIEDIAAGLLELYAKREMAKGNKFTLPSEYNDFAMSFGYEPTPDQEECFTAVIKDMTLSKPMDRLICGDVGFGKTEVAIRAAFIAAMNGTQVALLAPTTLLVEQHYENFVNRFAGFPIVIGEISRFKTKGEINQTLDAVTAGKIDILIGTHRLIQDDIKFNNLGLVIIDEEHRFGVKQKEKLKQLRTNVDFLAMTATPIPRTLSMALDGLRDFSIIATPPKRRLAVNTVICYDDNQIIREAILREIRRGGQVFFLFNEVDKINTMYEQLSSLIPEVAIAIAHGQMHENLLEQTIRDFIHQRYHILLCSTIVETGIDIANANTIIIYRADKLGLAQLHQLRGRVGRSHHQAYCYLVVPENITSNAEKRLEAIKATNELGSGFNLAMHDLEIRGAGEILGDSQSGDIKEVGLSLYTEMLKKAINKLKSGNKTTALNDSDLYCEVNLTTTSILPEDYCPDINERLIYYKRLARAETKIDIDLVYQNIMDNWGLPPLELQNLIETHYLRIKATKLGIQKLDVSSKQITLTFIPNPPVEPLKIILLLQQLKTCKYDGKNKLSWQIPAITANDKIKHANHILDELNK